MKRFTRSVAWGIIFLAFMIWNCAVWAQSAGMPNFGMGRSYSAAPPAAPNSGHTSPNTQTAAPQTHGSRGSVSSPAGQAAQAIAPPLGSMSFHAFPAASSPPGGRNFNQAGRQFSAPPAYGNINHPGGGPIPGAAQPHFRGGGGNQHGPGRGGEEHRGRRTPFFVPYYYGVPYAPYSYYDYYNQPYGYPPESPETAPPPPMEQPAYVEPPPDYTEPPPQGPSPRLYYVPPETTGSLPDEPPPAFEPQLDTSPRPKTRPVTLLAFKDQTIVAVTDYWLKGEEIHYKRADTEVGIPIEQLDFEMTQRLNQERNVPFTLESRP